VHKTRSEREATQREIERLEKDLQKAQKDEDRRALRERIRRLDAEQARLRRLLDALMTGAPG
jgi:dephospho-CoA kinase